MTFAIIAAILYGLAFGSFANALAYRFPTGESLMTRSHCTKCDMMITWWMNIPVFSWLFLRGKCFKCKDKISFQYPFVELLTTALFVLIVLKVSTMGLELIPGLLVSIAYCFFAFMGVVLSIIDIKTFQLPTKLIAISGSVSITLLALASVIMGDYKLLLNMLIGLSITGGFYGLIWIVKPAALGFGDVRLAPVVGAILGWLSIGHSTLAVLFPYIILSFALIPLMALKVVNGKTKIPFGPWIIGGTILAILIGDIVIDLFKTIGGL